MNVDGITENFEKAHKLIKVENFTIDVAQKCHEDISGDGHKATGIESQYDKKHYDTFRTKWVTPIVPFGENGCTEALGLQIVRPFLTGALTRGVYIKFLKKYEKMVNITVTTYSGRALPDYDIDVELKSDGDYITKRYRGFAELQIHNAPKT